LLHFWSESFSSHVISENLKIKIYKTIILLVALYGHETWSLTLWEEHNLRIFETRVLKRTVAPKWEEVAGGWRR
jgi:hypothetical protein